MTYQPLIAALSRRGFVIASISAAGGMMLGVRHGIAAATAPDGAVEVGAWIVIDPDDSVTIRVSKSEMGQGIFTALPMLVAEELGCDWRSVRAEYASANRNLTTHAYGSMGTGGSRSIRSLHETMQQVGASARARLIAAAAQQWNVPARECSASDGQVRHVASGRALGFGVLAAAAAKVQIAEEPAIKTPISLRLWASRLPGSIR